MIEVNIDKHVVELREAGLTLIPGVFSPETCRRYVGILNDVLRNLPPDSKNRNTDEVQSVNNYFRHDRRLLDLIYIPVVDALMSVLLEPDHVLVAANTFNRRSGGPVISPDAANAGDDWHVDSRYLGGRRMEAGFSYQVIIMLEPFTRMNSATQYVPGSHHRRGAPRRDGDYEFELIEGDAGTVAIIDSGIWHRSGPVSDRSRWGAFNLYGPWFMKPYFRFQEMLGPDTAHELTPQLRRLLHFRSTPPRDEEERLNTVVKEEEPPIVGGPWQVYPEGSSA